MTKIDWRQIEFTVRVTEGAKEIGIGSHSRVVIDVAKFVRRLEELTTTPPNAATARRLALLA